MNSSQSTTTTPSPLDQEKASNLAAITNMMMPYIMPNLQGGNTAMKQAGVTSNQNAMQGALSKSGSAPGNPAMLGGMGANTGISDIINYAMQFYGGAPQTPPSTNTTYNPGAPDYANSALQLGMIASMFGGGGGGSVAPYFSGGATTTDAGGSLINMPNSLVGG